MLTKRLIYYKLLELKCYFFYFFYPNRNGKKIILFAQGRTGSSLVESLLCSTGYFEPTNEPFNVIRKGEVWFPKLFIRGYAKMNKSPNFLFHVKFYQLKYDRKRPVIPRDFLDYLVSHGWEILFLNRSNKILHTLSLMVMLKRGQSGKKDDKDENLKLDLDLEQFEYLAKMRVDYEKEEMEIIKGLEYFEFNYEKDLLDSSKHQDTINRILDYLNLPKKEVNTRMRKVNNKSFEDLILNYDDFIKMVNRNNWNKYLE
jgi:LPS sulfotransferase NodH